MTQLNLTLYWFALVLHKFWLDFEYDFETNCKVIVSVKSWQVCRDYQTVSKMKYSLYITNNVYATYEIVLLVMRNRNNVNILQTYG